MNSELPKGKEDDGSEPEKNDSPGSKRGTLVATQFEGPIPPPNVLAGYENILPGLANRITIMAEDQSGHRQGLEKSVIFFDKVRAILGLCFAFLIVLAGFGAGVYLATKDQSIAAGIFTLGPLGTIAGVFVYQKREEVRSRDKKDE